MNYLNNFLSNFLVCSLKQRITKIKHLMSAPFYIRSYSKFMTENFWPLDRFEVFDEERSLYVAENRKCGYRQNELVYKLECPDS